MALNVDFQIDQGADWPGEQFYIVDAVGNPKTLDNTMTASGAIVDADGATIFTWSNTPAAGQGLVTYSQNLYVPIVTAAQSLTWSFKTADYQLYLTDPAAPVGQQTIRVGYGVVYLSHKIG